MTGFDLAQLERAARLALSIKAVRAARVPGTAGAVDELQSEMISLILAVLERHGIEVGSPDTQATA